MGVCVCLIIITDPELFGSFHSVQDRAGGVVVAIDSQANDSMNLPRVIFYGSTLFSNVKSYAGQELILNSPPASVLFRPT